MENVSDLCAIADFSRVKCFSRRRVRVRPWEEEISQHSSHLNGSRRRRSNLGSKFFRAALSACCQRNKTPPPAQTRHRSPWPPDRRGQWPTSSLRRGPSKGRRQLPSVGATRVERVRCGARGWKPRSPMGKGSQRWGSTLSRYTNVSRAITIKNFYDENTTFINAYERRQIEVGEITAQRCPQSVWSRCLLLS